MIDAHLASILDGLHARSDAQATEFRRYQKTTDEAFKVFRSDKLLALDRDKAAFCHQLIRTSGARRVVEVGASFGASTLWLAAAVRDNDGGMVFGTENEPTKVIAAKEVFEKAGLNSFITLLEGDARETLKKVDPPIDFVLIDSWIGVARPALELIAPKLRPGGIVVLDDSLKYRAGYAGYFAFVNDPSNGFVTTTLPLYNGGLELSVKQHEPDRLTATIRDIPMPARIACLSLTEKGYPLPFFAAMIDGKPDIRIVSTEKFHRCVNEHLCWLCGQPLDIPFVFVVPPNKITSSEPPCHDECAEYAMAACPFITNPSMKYRNRQKRPESYVMLHNFILYGSAST